MFACWVFSSKCIITFVKPVSKRSAVDNVYFSKMVLMTIKSIFSVFVCISKLFFVDNELENVAGMSRSDSAKRVAHPPRNGPLLRSSDVVMEDYRKKQNSSALSQCSIVDQPPPKAITHNTICRSCRARIPTVR